MTRSLAQRDDVSHPLGGGGTAALRDSGGGSGGSGKLNQAAESETFLLRFSIDFYSV